MKGKCVGINKDNLGCVFIITYQRLSFNERGRKIEKSAIERSKRKRKINKKLRKHDKRKRVGRNTNMYHGREKSNLSNNKITFHVSDVSHTVINDAFMEFKPKTLCVRLVQTQPTKCIHPCAILLTNQSQLDATVG